MQTWNALARIAMLCNRAEFQTGQELVPVLKRSSLPVFLLLLCQILLFLNFSQEYSGFDPVDLVTGEGRLTQFEDKMMLIGLRDVRWSRPRHRRLGAFTTRGKIIRLTRRRVTFYLTGMTQ